jgi:WD40 repeat protein
MRATIHRLAILAVLLPLAAGCSAVGEKLTQLQVARAGKAATALVKAKGGRGSGSAFCIHPDGWFVTSLRSSQGEIDLVLNPNSSSEKTCFARVVRSDPELDLALLRVEGVKDFPTLPLGSDEDLEEMQEVVYLGFPFTPRLSTGRGESPPISVNAGRIVALRRNGGRLNRIQLDAAFGPGHPGGPVLDRTGKVIGVAASGVVNLAIPVSAVSRFLARPEMQFEPPRLSRAELHEPARFEARVSPLLPVQVPLTAELILKVGEAPEQTVRMEPEGEVYRATTVPIPKGTGAWPLRLAATFDEATLEASAADRSFTIGGKDLKLSEVRTLSIANPSRVVLRDGKTIAGTVAGLGEVSVRLGDRTTTVDLAGAREVEVSPVPEPDRVAYTLVVREGEKEITRRSGILGSLDNLRVVEVARFHGHSSTVESAAISPDGRRILSGSTDRTMILWDRETGRMIRRFLGNAGGILSVAISPDGHRALSGGADRVLRLWDLETAAVIREFRGHAEPIFAVAFSPDGRLAYSTSGGPNHMTDGSDTAVRIWDLESGREVGKLEGHRGRVFGLAILPDGRRVLTGGDTSVILWDSQARSRIRIVGSHDGPVSQVVRLPEGRAASSSYDRSIRLWDLQSGQEIHRFHGHPREVTWLAASSDGRLLLSSDFNAHELRLWDVEGRKEIQRIDWTGVAPTRGSFTPDGEYATWGGSDGIVRVYRLTAEEAPASPIIPPDRQPQPLEVLPPSPRTSLVTVALGVTLLAVLAVVLSLYLCRWRWREGLGIWGSLRSKLGAVKTRVEEPQPSCSSRSVGPDEPAAVHLPAMRWTLKCPVCGHSEMVPQKFLGRKVKCPICREVFRVNRSELEAVSDRQPPGT